MFEEERERGRFFLWLPVSAISGALLFFAAGEDPSLWAALSLFVAASGAAFAARASRLGFPLAMAAVALSAGFLSSAVQTKLAAAPILERPLRGAVLGLVESVEPRARGVRLVIEVQELESLAAQARPERVRVTVPKTEGLAAGARVAVEALWRPPPGPVRPGGYDFAREAFFRGVGAVGSAAKRPVLLDVPELTLGRRLGVGIDKLRNSITARIVSVVPGDAGAIAAALVSGQRGEISNAATDALRVAGLYHVISISGLHMALFGGTLFFVLRLGLTLLPGMGLRRPVKKWAAAAALLGAAFYLALSGSEVAAQRSFVMIAIVFAAIIFDRQGVTLRNLAIAAFVAILLTPEAVLGPSFQMSFGAVMAIVAWYEARGRRAPDEVREAGSGGWSRALRVYFGGIAATTIAATLATAPFGTFHFQKIAVYSLPSNLVALPVVGVLVMPWAMLGLVLMPFGLDAPAWQMMGFGITIMLEVSRWIANWPGATAIVPAFSALALAMLALGLCWLALWTTKLRWFGLTFIAIGILVASVPERPDIYVEPGGRGAAARGSDGKLHVAGIRFASFAAESWLSADGDRRNVRSKEVVERVRCDSLGCTLPLDDGKHLALSWSYAALKEDCSQAAIVVTRLVAPPSCRQTALVIDGADLAEKGAMGLTRGADGSFEIATARGHGHRIWHGTPALPAGPAFPSATEKTGEPPHVEFDPTDADEEEPGWPEADEPQANFQ